MDEQAFLLIQETLRELREGQRRLQEGFTRLETRFNSMPPYPTRPCPDFIQHLREHERMMAKIEKRQERLWQVVLKWGWPVIVGVAAYLFGQKGVKP
jgi:hypothetical protein